MNIRTKADYPYRVRIGRGKVVRDWFARQGTPIMVRVVYHDHEEVLR